MVEIYVRSLQTSGSALFEQLGQGSPYATFWRRNESSVRTSRKFGLVKHCLQSYWPNLVRGNARFWDCQSPADPLVCRHFCLIGRGVTKSHDLFPTEVLIRSHVNISAVWNFIRRCKGKLYRETNEFFACASENLQQQSFIKGSKRVVTSTANIKSSQSLVVCWLFHNIFHTLRMFVCNISFWISYHLTYFIFDVTIVVRRLAKLRKIAGEWETDKSPCMRRLTHPTSHYRHCRINPQSDRMRLTA